MKRPPTYPAERAYPCCLPALGEFGMMPPRGGLARSLGERFSADQSTGTRRISPLGAAPVASSAEDSPSGLWRSLGKRVGLTALRGSNPLSSATLACAPPGVLPSTVITVETSQHWSVPWRHGQHDDLHQPRGAGTPDRPRAQGAVRREPADHPARGGRPRVVGHGPRP